MSSDPTNDADKSREELLGELAALRQRLSTAESADVELTRLYEQVLAGRNRLHGLSRQLM